MSPLRKIVKYGNATKTLRHQDSQRKEIQNLKLSVSLCL